MTKEIAQKLQRVYKYSKQLLGVAKQIHSIDSELYMAIIEYHDLVCVLVDNLDMYSDEELNEIITEFEDVLKTLVRRMRREV